MGSQGRQKGAGGEQREGGAADGREGKVQQHSRAPRAALADGWGGGEEEVAPVEACQAAHPRGQHVQHERCAPVHGCSGGALTEWGE